MAETQSGKPESSLSASNRTFLALAAAAAGRANASFTNQRTDSLF